ncbi:hypothetical protein OG800_02255 [Streptomyces sp. NBC_00445]|uniref:hypothetical protein n=1 Tax=unclassified Streptomyces TaxID=2593676 RepID=UPI002E211DC6|nr:MULTISPECIES: hypothetical protein [unclassified Streptomyces]
MKAAVIARPIVPGHEFAVGARVAVGPGIAHPAPPPSSWPPRSPTARSCPTACAGKIQIQPGPASS